MTITELRDFSAWLFKRPVRAWRAMMSVFRDFYLFVVTMDRVSAIMVWVFWFMGSVLIYRSLTGAPPLDELKVLFTEPWMPYTVAQVAFTVWVWLLRLLAAFRLERDNLLRQLRD
jgi:hypothetical protein